MTITKPAAAPAIDFDFGEGVLVAPQIEALIEGGVIRPGKNRIAKNQIQPASIDLRLGERCWRIRASFLPGKGNRVEPRLGEMKMYEVDISEGAVLEKDCVYIAEIQESLDLPDDIAGHANPKSSTGRLDVFTRLITDEATEFEAVRAGYSGRLYAEISPRTFAVRVRRGTRLSQLRLRRGNARISDDDTKRLQKEARLASPSPHAVKDGGFRLFYDIGRDIRDGVPLSVDLSGSVNPDMPGLVGWRARKHAGVVDVDAPGSCDVAQFWERVTIDDLLAGEGKSGRGRGRRQGLILNPDEFYILASAEYVTVPEDHAAEMSAYDTSAGEFRAHYAGFFDPGFGVAELGAARTRAVLEVRSHDVPFLIEEGQVVCRLVYEKLSATPGMLYGAEGSGSHYQSQGLQLSKHFRPPN